MLDNVCYACLEYMVNIVISESRISIYHNHIGINDKWLKKQKKTIKSFVYIEIKVIKKVKEEYVA